MLVSGNGGGGGDGGGGEKGEEKRREERVLGFLYVYGEESVRAVGVCLCAAVLCVSVLLCECVREK